MSSHYVVLFVPKDMKQEAFDALKEINSGPPIMMYLGDPDIFPDVYIRVKLNSRQIKRIQGSPWLRCIDECKTRPEPA